ncbi:hypothetical protein AVEN_238353-1 [Araneus ventricosus]|uniref:Uncharacterized protein n=1 Tax=Araneus ventricosus TaxID=182803 RepID=A0A4Y2UZ42_ARAVE|nr:hypothetical protein AVEN_238353-1 [Araneus ventricosus]
MRRAAPANYLILQKMKKPAGFKNTVHQLACLLQTYAINKQVLSACKSGFHSRMFGGHCIIFFRFREESVRVQALMIPGYDLVAFDNAVVAIHHEHPYLYLDERDLLIVAAATEQRLICVLCFGETGFSFRVNGVLRKSRWVEKIARGSLEGI